MLEEEIKRVLEPLVQRVVREEVERAKLRWRWLTVKQASETLGLSEAAIYQRARKNLLPHRRLDGRIFIDMDALDRQLETLQ